MRIEPFTDMHQVAPHKKELPKGGIAITHEGNDFKKSILEMSMTLAKYVSLIRLFRKMLTCSR